MRVVVTSDVDGYAADLLVGKWDSIRVLGLATGSTPVNVYGRLIQRYYDGETIGNENAVVERLLEEDPQARDMLASLRTISGAIRTEVAAAVAEEDFSNFWSDVSVRLPKGPLTLETGQDAAKRAQQIADGELLTGEPEALQAPSSWGWLQRLLGGPGLAVVGAALCLVALFAPVWSTTDESAVPVAGIDQSIEVEEIDSPGTFVMVVQESADVPAIVWVTETSADEG